MVAFKSRTLLFFDARTWTLIIAWYQIITCTLDISRSHRQLQRYYKLNEQLPVIYHNFTKALNVEIINSSEKLPDQNQNQSLSGHEIPGGKIKKEGLPSSTLSISGSQSNDKGKDSNNTITIIITLDNVNRIGNSNSNSNSTTSTSPSSSTIPAHSNSNPAQNASSTTNTFYNVSGTPSASSLSSALNKNLSVWDEIEGLKNSNVTNSYSASSLEGNSGEANITNTSTLTRDKNTTLSNEETKSQFLFRFRYTIIMIWADIVIYSITGVAGIILIIGTNKGSAGMLMTWLVANWINFLLALFAMIIVMLRALPINTFVYCAMKTAIRMLFIRVVSIHRREILIYNDICQHLASIRQAQQAVFTMSDGMTHVNYVNP